MSLQDEFNVEELNKGLEKLSPKEIVEWVFELNKKTIVTTNFRPYEVALLHLVTKDNPSIKVVWCDTGYNTPQTYKHAEELIDKLSLNVHLYVPKQTVAHRNITMGLPSVEDENHEKFTEQVKLEPFKRAMAEHQPEIWFTNLRKGQTAFRDSIGVISFSKEGVLKVSPFYNWSDKDLDEYLSDNKLPNEFKYFDPTKVESNRECGLHI
ncbi:phosphoadenosine phosphosulfate reductase family protein [Tenacibaculum sp. HL-MS23]|uniref:phosphoadenosine phosphosulfate reductase domain-containing protein n=1 Tax=Tenacibaculum TaxID=104267 RepID=UPI001C4EFFBD|nr:MULTISPECIES: phosphoadenosine phosphosulfate reductase family protein [Tenacibaculum]QXP73570.1 phosphoadenosine phosphosulfate reductase family protein [Tenacibaculum sp. AHE14PA]WNW02629.1 phosphoadenosine phosphosulfate reductase family protein [Tenacibaculum sp. HL-MS23]